jgi:hypothetical protein
MIKFLKENKINYINIKIKIIEKFVLKILQNIKFYYFILFLTIFLFGIYFIIIFSNLSFSPLIWLVLNLFYWIILPLSVFKICKIVYILIRNKNISFNNIKFLFYFYCSFVLILVSSIIVDRFIPEVAVGANLEIRILPYAILFAIPLAIKGILSSICHLSKIKFKNVVIVGLVLFVCVSMINSIIKAKLDPNFSEKWIFYTESEKNSLNYIERNFNNSTFWTGLDNRLESAYYFESDFNNFQNINFNKSVNVSNILISETIEKRAKKMNVEVFYFDSSNQIFSNGKVNIFNKQD